MMHTFFTSKEKRKIAGLSALIFALVVICQGLYGCGQPEEKETIELTFIHGWGGTVKTHATMQGIYEEFERLNPDIILKFQPSSDSSIAVKKANDMLAVDKMPDIVSTNGQSYYINNAVKRKKALNLMPYMKADKDFLEQIHPSVLESWTTEDGELYTVPDALEVMGYWYNADYFKQAGIVDGSGEVKTPATWEEFYSACDKLTEWAEENDTGKLKCAYSLETVQVTENLFLARLAGSGEEGLRMTEGIPQTFDTEAFRKSVEDFSKIFSYSKNAESLDDAREYFKNGRTAMFFNGIWESEELAGASNALHIEYANYPSDIGKSISYISPSSGYILAAGADDRKKDAAVLFLKYMLSEQVQLKLALLTGQAPSNPQVDTDKVIKAYPMLGNALKKAHEADIQIKTISSVWNSGLMEVLNKELKNACESKAGMERLITEMNHKTNSSPNK